MEVTSLTKTVLKHRGRSAGGRLTESWNKTDKK